MMYLQTVSNPTTLFALGAALIFAAICLGTAFFVLAMLKKTVKTAVRLTLAGVLAFIAVIGGVSLWWFFTGSENAKKPAATRSK